MTVSNRTEWDVTMDAGFIPNPVDVMGAPNFVEPSKGVIVYHQHRSVWIEQFVGMGVDWYVAYDHSGMHMRSPALATLDEAFEWLNA